MFFGRLAERYRRDLSFLLGVGLFTAASAACSISNNVETLIAFRVLQAAGAALMTPTSIGLLMAVFPPERRGSAVRTWTAIGGLAAALGPVIGGLLVTVNWRWIFLVNVPIGVIAMLIGWWKLPQIPGHAAPRPNPRDAALVTGGIGALTFAIVKVNDWGWASPGIAGSAAAAIILLALFVWRCFRSPQSVRRSRTVPDQAVRRRGAGDGALFGRLRRDAVVGRVVGADGVGMVGAEDRPRDRARPAAGADHLAVAGGPADRALRRGAGGHRGHFLLCRGPGVLGALDRAERRTPPRVSSA